MNRWQRAQDRLALLLGCETSARERIIHGMLRREPGEVGGYWLQLVVAVAIASLGLVLGSTAVVIGAMLIAPLMSPILRLGMGLAVGSPFLVLRSSGRILASIALAVGCSTLLTLLLPFHETTAEIAARTAPTVLDLLTAAFCALAGVYATMRPSSDVASTAAGTSIGISLVPPLCASGYGVGTGAWSIASGAALLFLTNFVAIVVVASVMFAAAGFGQASVQRLEQEELGRGSGAQFTGRLAKAFASRGGWWMRLAMPLALLIVVYLPLRKALDDLAWQFKVRSTVDAAVSKLPVRVVQSSIRMEGGQIDLGLLLLGNAAQAQHCRALLTQLLTEAGLYPRLEIAAVPDARAFAGLEAKLRTNMVPTVAPPPPDPLAGLDGSRNAVWTTVEHRWPGRTAGRLLSVTMDAGGASELRLRVTHLGTNLDAVAQEALELALGRDLGRDVKLIDEALPAAEIAIDHDAAPLQLVQLARSLELAAASPELTTCVVQPEAKVSRRSQATATPLNRTMLALLSERPRTLLRKGDRWRVRFSLEGCSEESEPADLPPQAR